MKITKSQLKQIIKEEFGNVMAEQSNDVEQLIEQGRSFFDQVIQLSMDSEDDPDAAQKLNQIEEALSREVDEKSHGYVKFTIIG
jgi:flagellar biosynthesis/type III secretory pathway chaperone